MLDRPARVYFDEAHYVPQATALMQYGFEIGEPLHPPLGKWLIAGGIWVLGENPVGWRSASAVAGILIVLVVYAAGRRLFRHAGAALLGAGLVAVDGLALTMSRIAMLDIFLALFVVTGFYFLVRARGSPQRRWPYLAGIAFGCALAVKWPAAAALAVAVLFMAAWEAGGGGRRIMSRVLAPLVVLPIAVYVATYAPWFVAFERTPAAVQRCEAGSCPSAAAGRVSTWVAEQVEMGRGLLSVPTTHPGRSSPLGWPVLRPPLAIFRLKGHSAEQHIVAVGNPVLWWLAVAAAGALAWRAVRGRDPTARLLVAFAVTLWLPWLASPKSGFLYYMLPAVPFLGLMVAALADDALGNPRLRWVPGAVGVVAVAVFAWLYPILSAMPIDHDAAEARLWLFR